VADIPLSILRYVERTGERVVLRDAEREGLFLGDEHVSRQHLRSVLSMPVMKQKKVIGTLYLENNLVAGAFTPERCRVLELLSAQAAISLENARLYDTLEQRVRERTRELRASNEELSLALQQLRETQAQLIMREKLASLGALASGIAHEIKNPLNFINNFALISTDLVDELHSLVMTQRERLEAQYVREMNELTHDIRNNVTKINEHGKRADSIVRSMLELSNSGGGNQSEVDLNGLVSQFVNLASQGMRPPGDGTEGGVELNLDAAMQPLLVMPQELGRVVLNLLNNAFYAVQERRKTAAPGYSPRIRVSTRELGNRVELRVRDNGTGIPAAILGKIFNPFFTTKPAGQGTGLGLALSHDIVVQGHGGTLTVDSIEGQHTELVVTLPRRASPSDSQS
jgi:signal transduction histidine kinase